MIDRLVDFFSQALLNERTCYICKVPFRAEISSSLPLSLHITLTLIVPPQTQTQERNIF